MIITRGLGVAGDRIITIVNFIEQAIGHLEEENRFIGELEEKDNFMGVLQKLPDEYIGHLDDEDVVEGGVGDE